MKKYLTILTVFIVGSVFAEINFSNQDLTGRDFSNQDLTDARFYDVNLTDASFYGANLTNAIFSSNSLQSKSVLGNANFTNAIIKGAQFNAFDTSMGEFPYGNEKSSLTLEQLYSTASYKNNDLCGEAANTATTFMSQRFNNADFDGFNLKNVNFIHTDLANAKFNNAIINGTVLYGSNFSVEQLYSTASYKNKDLSNLIFHRYQEYHAVLNLSEQKLSNSEFYDFENIIVSDALFESSSFFNSKIFLEKNSIVLNIKNLKSPAITLSDESFFNLSDGKLIVNLADEFVLNDKEINIMSWDDGTTITGFDKLVKGENLILKQNGLEFNDDFWSFEVRSDGLYISVPEPSTYAAIFGALALAFAAYRRRK